MLLAIDSGNTNATFGLFDQDKLINSWRISTDTARTADQYAVWLLKLFEIEGYSHEDIENVIIANVVPATDRAFRGMSEKYLKQFPMVIGDAAIDLGIDIMTQTPKEAGADRVVNVVGAYTKIKQAGMVIDFGTATTFDVLDEKGNYRGGVIAPGVNLSLKALVDAAAQLAAIPIRKPEKVIGETTRQAMESGTFWGYVGLVEGLINRIKDETGQDMKVIATGGLSQLFADAIQGIDHVADNLTLEGLLEIYKRNIV